MKTRAPFTFSMICAVLLAGCMHPAPAPMAPATAPAVAATRAEPLPWIEDDWAKALAAGRAANKPIVIDFWATWCHYCTAAEATTLRSPEVTAFRDRFVWARIDTDKPENGDLLARLQLQGLPDYLIVDPADESIVGRWLGSARPEQFRNTLRDAERVYQAAHANALAADDPLRLVVEAQRASKKEDHPAAAALFAKAIAAAPADWDRRDDTIDGEVTELVQAGRAREAIDLALSIPEADHSSSAADTISTAADAIGALPKETPKKEREQLTDRLLDRMLAIAHDEAAPVDTDVRVAVWAEIRAVYDARGKEKKVRAATEKMLALLDAAAKSAPDPMSASAYNSGRTSALLALDRPDEAIALLKQSENDLPDQPDPPSRLARVYERLQRWDDAVAEADKAIARAPKRFAVELMFMRATILREAKRDADACSTLHELVSQEATLPASERMPELVTRAQKQIATACPQTAKR